MKSLTVYNNMAVANNWPINCKYLFWVLYKHGYVTVWWTSVCVQEGATTFVFENDMGNHGCSYMHT